MVECVRGIDDFLSPLPQAPVPLEVLERVESKNTRIETVTPLKQRHRGSDTYIHDFIITVDGTAYGLRFEDDEWAVVATSKEVDDVTLAMENEA